MATHLRLPLHVCMCASCQQHPYSATAEQHRALNRALAALDERNRRRLVGLFALQWGRGGVQRLIEITGLSRNTIVRGRQELQHPGRTPRLDRIRRPGAGRPRVEKNSRAC